MRAAKIAFLFPHDRAGGVRVFRIVIITAQQTQQTVVVCVRVIRPAGIFDDGTAAAAAVVNVYRNLPQLWSAARLDLIITKALCVVVPVVERGAQCQHPGSISRHILLQKTNPGHEEIQLDAAALIFQQTDLIKYDVLIPLQKARVSRGKEKGFFIDSHRNMDVSGLLDLCICLTIFTGALPADQTASRFAEHPVEIILQFTDLLSCQCTIRDHKKHLGHREASFHSFQHLRIV